MHPATEICTPGYVISSLISDTAKKKRFRLRGYTGWFVCLKPTFFEIENHVKAGFDDKIEFISAWPESGQTYQWQSGAEGGREGRLV